MTETQTTHSLPLPACSFEPVHLSYPTTPLDSGQHFGSNADSVVVRAMVAVGDDEDKTK